MPKTKLTFYLIYGLVFVTTLTDAIAGHIQSSYLNQFLPLEYIGLFISIVTVIAIIVSFAYPHLVRCHSSYRLLITAYLLTIATNFIMSTETAVWVILVSYIVRYLSLIFIFVNLDILLENISDDDYTGMIRSKYLTALNTAWLISPLIMGYLVGDNNNYQRTYYIGGLLLLPVLFLLITRHRQSTETKKRYRRQSAIVTIKQLFGDHNRRGIFLSSLALQFFYGLMCLYIPIYLHKYMGLDWATLGVVFTIMLLPFVLIQMPAGILADRFFGEKEMLIIGNLIMIISVTGIFFTKTANPFVWGFLLFFSRVGAALAESMQETYFFKQVDSQDMAVISLYRQNKPIGRLIASLTAFITLSFLPINSIFMVLAIGLVIGLIPIFSIHDTR